MLDELKSLQDRAKLRRTQAANARRHAPGLRRDDEIRLLAYAASLEHQADLLTERAAEMQAWDGARPRAEERLSG